MALDTMIHTIHLLGSIDRGPVEAVYLQASDGQLHGSFLHLSVLFW